MDLHIFFASNSPISGESPCGIVTCLSLFLANPLTQEISFLPSACKTGSITYKIGRAIAQIFPDRSSDDSLRLIIRGCINDHKTLWRKSNLVNVTKFLQSMLNLGRKRWNYPARLLDGWKQWLGGKCGNDRFFCGAQVLFRKKRSSSGESAFQLTWSTAKVRPFESSNPRVS